MVNCELVRLDADRKPMKAIYPAIKNHPVSKLDGEIDYDGKPENRFEFGYFSLLRARLLALWSAKEISASHLGKMLAAVAESNLGTTSFSDESEIEANDETVIKMFNSLKDVNMYLQNCDVEWVTPFAELSGYADTIMCQKFGTYLLRAVVQLKNEAVKILSEEQLDAYMDLAEFLLGSPYGVGMN